MDWNIRRRVCSARKGQKRVVSFGVPVSDLRPSVMRMDLGKARQIRQGLIYSSPCLELMSYRSTQTLRPFSTNTGTKPSTFNLYRAKRTITVTITKMRHYALDVQSL